LNYPKIRHPKEQPNQENKKHYPEKNLTKKTKIITQKKTRLNPKSEKKPNSTLSSHPAKPPN
jgi:hypothetical protein